MVFVANLCTHRTHSHPVIHLASVAVVPVLVHELFLRHSECAELVAERILILREKMTTRIILHVHVALKKTVIEQKGNILEWKMFDNKCMNLLVICRNCDY